MTQPIKIMTGRPQSWWRRAGLRPVLVAGLVAVLLGVWVYVSKPVTPEAQNAHDGKAVTADAVVQALAAGKPTVVEFGANNCVSCREMKPVLHALAQDPRITVTDVDILKERAYISRYQIQLMPTQVFYDVQGRETGRHMGKISGDDILARLGLSSAQP